RFPSSLPAVPHPESDRARAASPTVARLLAVAVTDPCFESAAVFALVAELLDFAAACRLDYASALVDVAVSASPPSVGGECALGTDILEDKQEDFECLAAAPHLRDRRPAPRPLVWPLGPLGPSAPPPRPLDPLFGPSAPLGPLALPRPLGPLFGPAAPRPLGPTSETGTRPPRPLVWPHCPLGPSAPP
ncbi:unnamed protein product, partial [Closterium sp. NIES-53]